MHSKFAVSFVILKFASGNRWLPRLSIISTLLPSFHVIFVAPPALHHNNNNNNNNIY